MLRETRLFREILSTFLFLMFPRNPRVLKFLSLFLNFFENRGWNAPKGGLYKCHANVD